MPRFVTKQEVRARISSILAKYPFFEEYPVACHAKCARRDIDYDYGYAAGDAWDEYQSALYLLGED